MTIQGVLGIFAGALIVPTIGFYVAGILRGTTRPNRVTWWILALISAVVVFSYHDVGAWDTLWLPIAYTISYVVIGLLSFKYGDGPFTLSTLDRVALVGGIASVIAYAFAQSPALALLLSTLSEAIALFPTAVKAYKNPETEDRTAWIIGTTASVINLFAIAEWSLEIAAYPIWVFVSNALIVYFLVRTRVSHKTQSI